MSSSSLTLIGNGWLGQFLLPICATHFIIRTTTRQPRAQTPFLNLLFDWRKDRLPALAHAHHYIIAIPPTDARENYAVYMASLAKQLSPQAHIIFISSSSVYQSMAGEYDEDSAINRKNIIYQAENALRIEHPQSTILRCAGLYGKNRLLGKRYFGQLCPLPNQRLNLVHGQDVAQAIFYLLTHRVQGEIFNLCEPSHPWRHEVYRFFAQQTHQAAPKFTSTQQTEDRLILGDKITKILPFSYQHCLLK